VLGNRTKPGEEDIESGCEFPSSLNRGCPRSFQEEAAAEGKAREAQSRVNSEGKAS
jgi:hypothetical protein